MLNHRLGRRWAARGLAALLAATMLGGCSSLSGSSDGSSSPSIGDRFSQLLGGSSQPVGSGASTSNTEAQDCPEVFIRNGASTLSVGASGRAATGTDVRFQATITDTVRECRLNGGQIGASVGIRGRIIVGPAGAPPATDIPLRVALVQEGATPKTIFTKLYRVNVAIPAGEGNTPYSFVAEDVVYPVPVGDAGDTYVFYVGFDPAGLRAEPAPRAAKKKK